MQPVPPQELARQPWRLAWLVRAALWALVLALVPRRWTCSTAVSTSGWWLLPGRRWVRAWQPVQLGLARERLLQQVRQEPLVQRLGRVYRRVSGWCPRPRQ